MSAITDPRGDLQWGTIPGLVEDAAARFGELEALVDVRGPGGTTIRLSFDQLAEEAAAVTRAIVANGIDRGDRVGIWAPNCAEWIVAALGTVGAGAVLVPLDTRCSGEEAASVLRHSGARILFTIEGGPGADYPALLHLAAIAGHKVPELERVVLLRTDGHGSVRSSTATGDPVVEWEVFVQEGRLCSADVAAGRTASITSGDLSDLLYASGSEGAPRGVMTTHGQTLRTYATWAEVVGLHEGDRYLALSPFFGTFGYKAGILACLMTGATMAPLPRFDVEGVIRQIADERVTVLAAPPTMVEAILDRPGGADVDLPTLRLVVTGGAAVPIELVRSLRGLGIKTVLAGYGLAEATGLVAMCRTEDSDEVIAGTSGRAIPDVQVRVVGSDGTECPRGQTGEVLVRGYNVMRGYFNDIEATDRAVDPEGWLHTGDVGAMDPAGNLAVTDRRHPPAVAEDDVIEQGPGRRTGSGG